MSSLQNWVCRADYTAPAATEPETSLWDPEWDDETAADEVADKIRQELENNLKKAAAK
jgi:hypothetical protein